MIQASDGSSALELIRTRQDHIDAMLLDVTLPGASAAKYWKKPSGSGPIS